MEQFFKIVTDRITVGVVVVLTIIVVGGLRYLQGSSEPPQHWVFVTGAILFTVLLAVLLVALGSRSDLLRDSCPSDFGTACGGKLRRPFSLAQTQMARWFYLVLAAYVYLLLTGGDSTISTQALTLMGIGTGTALGAAAVEQTKSNAKLERLEALIKSAANAKPQTDGVNPFQQPLNDLAQQLASEDFFTDILTDVDGICLHRFQAAAWTIILGAVFVAEVFMHGKMPDFDPKMLALLGISGGAYLGFKIPEQPA